VQAEDDVCQRPNTDVAAESETETPSRNEHRSRCGWQAVHSVSEAHGRTGVHGSLDDEIAREPPAFQEIATRPPRGEVVLEASAGRHRAGSTVASAFAEA